MQNSQNLISCMFLECTHIQYMAGILISLFHGIILPDVRLSFEIVLQWLKIFKYNSN